jgi:hypothetical protein
MRANLSHSGGTSTWRRPRFANAPNPAPDVFGDFIVNSFAYFLAGCPDGW